VEEDDYNIRRLDRKEWSNLASGFLDYNYRQLWAFGNEAANRVGAISEYVAICYSNKIIGLANVRIKKLPLFNIGIAYITGGPLVRKRKQQGLDSFRLCLKVLQHEYVRKRSLILRIICPIAEKNCMSEQIKLFENANYSLTNMSKVYRTMVVDLERSESEIRTGLHQKWRNCLNRSEKNHLNIIKGTDTTIFQKFNKLYMELRERKNFDVDLEPDFYEKVQQELENTEKFVVHVAEFEGKPVAAHVGSYLGDTAVYLLGASNIKGNDMNASYLLQWHVMNYAKEKGCRWYDLGGIDPDNNPDVFRFKKRMGGIELTAAGPFQIIPTGGKGQLTLIIEHIYRVIMRVI